MFGGHKPHKFMAAQGSPTEIDAQITMGFGRASCAKPATAARRRQKARPQSPRGVPGRAAKAARCFLEGNQQLPFVLRGPLMLRNSHGGLAGVPGRKPTKKVLGLGCLWSG